ncbi:MAG: hypothetical protein ACKPJD_21725, partial [Planctomycetaceae bacterium]
MVVLLAGCEQRPAAVPEAQAAATAGAATEVTAAAAATEFVKPPLTDAEIAEGWISLFDQKTLFGWQVPQASNWRVEDAAIVVDEGEK